VAIGVQGYRALTHEEVAATVRTEPLGPQQFRATVLLPDGRTGQFTILGDAFYMDAHILKWKPIVNLLGLHTGYQLDRVGGRYNALQDEQQRPRTVFRSVPRGPWTCRVRAAPPARPGPAGGRGVRSARSSAPRIRRRSKCAFPRRVC
jgi:hypothetical protein